MSERNPLAPLDFEQWTDDARARLPRYLRRPELYLADGQARRPLPKVLGLMAHNAALGGAWLDFNEVLAAQTTIDVRLRELIILRVAWQTGCAYEWAQHTRIGASAGLTPEQIHAIPDGATAANWSPVERAVLSATDQMIERSTVDASVRSRLEMFFDGPQMLELLFVVGAYVCFALVCNSAGLTPDEPADVVDAPSLRVSNA
jgi:4-carboxymuconolactone decarboxylase